MPRPLKPPTSKVPGLAVMAGRGRRGGLWTWRFRKRISGKDIGFAGRMKQSEAESMARRRLADPSTYLPSAAADEHKSDAWVILTAGDLINAWAISTEDRSLSRHTKRLYRSAARRLIRYIGEVPVGSVVDATVRDLGVRMREDFAVSTTDTALRCLRLAWTWGREQGYVERELTWPKRQPVKQLARRMPSDEEVARALAHLDPGQARWPVKLVAQVLYATGARVGEVAGEHGGGLRWGQYEPWDARMQTGWLNVKGKTGDRRIPLPRWLCKELDRWHKATGGADDDLVWRVKARTIITGHHGLSERLKAACEAAGVPPFTCHALRDLRATKLLNAGVDGYVYEQIMGHGATLARHRYARPMPERMAEAVRGVSSPPPIVGPWKQIKE